MLKSVALCVCSLFAPVYIAGCGSSSSTDMEMNDVDQDGIPNASDPNPNGSLKNLLNGTFTGGTASVVEITAVDHNGAENSNLLYRTDLSMGCGTQWYPQGTLCDEPPATHSKTVSEKTTPGSGATWVARDSTAGLTTGILVIDACKTQGSCTAIDFNAAHVFQMFSDGKTTSIRLSVHAEMGATPPPANGAGWQVVGGGFVSVGAGMDTNNNGSQVQAPLVIPISPTQVTRYVRVEVRNDSSLGSPDYIELRSLKLFGAPPL